MDFLSLRISDGVAFLTAIFLAFSACAGVVESAEPLRWENEPIGALPYDESLRNRLQAAWSGKDKEYQPRTKHLRPDGTPKYTNRLFLETSPYLRQHAHNPVNWFPWGDEAFALAAKLDRPVLLSVGYSTCHWCHVMEEESFENEEIAKYLNENYIAIKVDREERPDIDAVYMAAVQALTGSGGWPMNVWLTPERKPFYGGTYFPPNDGDRGARAGFRTVIERMRTIWDTQRDDVATNASIFVEKINASLRPPAGDELPGEEAMRSAAAAAEREFDPVQGGVKGAPKFPSSLPLRFLLRYSERSGDPKYREMTALTLEKLAAGGIHDQVGGGFHRYSTDSEWLVPHFEKMLYDNALLTVAYLEAHQATGRADFAEVAQKTLRYLERDMMSPEGAFYSATDADSPNPSGEREEGWFFTWTPAEIGAALDDQEADAVRLRFGVSEEGNYEGRNILHVAAGEKKAASALELSLEKLYKAREKRPHPLRDEKILTSWNGLAISAFARAAHLLDDDKYAKRAAAAAEFILTKMREDGRLRRSYKDGAARNAAFLDDYAFLIAGLIDLFEATGESRWLAEAITLDRVLEAQFEDSENGGFFLASDDHEELLAREKPSYDGAEPSGNSVAVLNLLRLYEFTTDDAYRKRAERALRSFEKIFQSAPLALSEMLVGVDFFLSEPKEIIVVENAAGGAEPFLAEMRKVFAPNRILAVVSEGAELESMSEVIPLVEGKRAIGGRTTAFVCTRGVCKLPTSDPDVFRKQLIERARRQE